MPGHFHSEVSPNGVFVLDPPYRVLRGIGREAPPLGAIITVDLASSPLAWLNVRTIPVMAPWCALCLVERMGGSNHLLAPLFEPFPGAYATLLLGKSLALDSGRVVESVRQRPAPPSLELAAYVARRTRRRDLLEPLQECFEAAAGSQAITSACRSRLCRHLADFKPWTARDWAAISRLIRVHSWAAGCASTPSLEQAANDNRMDPRTLLSRHQRYVRCTYSDAVRRAGWEWMVEAALRVGGYIRQQAGDTLRRWTDVSA